MSMKERYERGLELLRQVDGDGGVQVVDSLKDLAPDVGRYIIEFAFGDIYARGGLSLRDRELATIASLCTQGACEPQLKVHIRGALNAGMTGGADFGKLHSAHPVCWVPESAQRYNCCEGSHVSRWWDKLSQRLRCMQREPTRSSPRKAHRRLDQP